MSEDPGGEPEDGAESEAEVSKAIRRTMDLFVYAPVGLAVTALEDLPGLIVKGRQRLESEVRNARFVGQFVVTKGQHDLAERVGKLFGGAEPPSPAPPPPAAGAPEPAPEAPVRPPSAPAPSPTSSHRPAADPADAAMVESALPGYDTLSASQVVRRLESLGADELGAVQRHEASHRSRRTILNRTQQLLSTPSSDGHGTMAGPGPDSASLETDAE